MHCDIQETMDPGDDENTPLIRSSTPPPPLASGTPALQASGPRAPHGFYEKRVQAGLAEFYGTLLFVFLSTMLQQNELLLANAIGNGLAIGLLILSLGQLSGGHFNPAVSLGAWLAGGIDLIPMIIYWIGQFSGGIIGAAITRGCLSYQKQVMWRPPSNGTVYEQIEGGAVMLQEGAGEWEGILTEFFLTAILVGTVILTSIDTRTKMPTAGLAIGFAVVADTAAGGSITEACMNPARALGPAILVSDFLPVVWTYHYIYWVGPFLGAAYAGLVYRLFFAASDRRLIFKKEQ